MICFRIVPEKVAFFRIKHTYTSAFWTKPWSGPGDNQLPWPGWRRPTQRPEAILRKFWLGHTKQVNHLWSTSLSLFFILILVAPCRYKERLCLALCNVGCPIVCLWQDPLPPQDHLSWKSSSRGTFLETEPVLKSCKMLTKMAAKGSKRPI